MIGRPLNMTLPGSIFRSRWWQWESRKRRSFAKPGESWVALLSSGGEIRGGQKYDIFLPRGTRRVSGISYGFLPSLAHNGHACSGRSAKCFWRRWGSTCGTAKGGSVPLAHNTRLLLFSRKITFVNRNIKLGGFLFVGSHLEIQLLILL